jgi:NAD(P)-dependent dehydrogenase (short-subunit alcohol dehydrogenase family)
MTNLNRTVAVVTGAGRGIGREIALHQANAGAKVAVLARTASEIDEPILPAGASTRWLDGYFAASTTATCLSRR